MYLGDLASTRPRLYIVLYYILYYIILLYYIIIIYYTIKHHWNSISPLFLLLICISNAWGGDVFSSTFQSLLLRGEEKVCNLRLGVEVFGIQLTRNRPIKQAINSSCIPCLVGIKKLTRILVQCFWHLVAVFLLVGKRAISIESSTPKIKYVYILKFGVH